MAYRFHQAGSGAACSGAPPRAVIVLFALLHYAAVSSAGNLQELSVMAQDGEYRLHIIREIDAPAAYVYHVITDYRNAARINPAITEVEILPSGGAGVVRVRNRTEYRFGPFHLNIDWVGDITERPDGELDIITVPELSSFEAGRARWKIVPEGYHTVVSHESSFRPKFFIPPVLGEYFVRNYVLSNTLATFNRIECRARILQVWELAGDIRELEQRLTRGEDCSGAAGDAGHRYVFQGPE